MTKVIMNKGRMAKSECHKAKGRKEKWQKVK